MLPKTKEDDFEIKNEGEWWVAVDKSTNVASQGKTYKKARENLKEALELYYEDEEETNIPVSDAPWF